MTEQHFKPHVLLTKDDPKYLDTLEQIKKRIQQRVPSKYVGLHQHSEHSFLDGYSKTSHIARRAKELGQKSTAITDHGECGGHLEFYKACTKEGVKPILGMEGYWSWDIADSRERKTRGYDNSHITLLAKNQKGLSNLWAWSSIAYNAEHFYNKPQADPALMREYSEGLYASDGCLLTEFARSIETENYEKCREIYGLLLGIFGDSFYSELHTFQIMDPQTEEHQKLNAEMARMNQYKVELCTELSIPMTVVNDCHYSWPEDWENHELVWAMSTGGDMDKMDRGQAAAHHMGDEEIYYWMGKHGVARSVVERAINYTGEVADQCNVEIKSTLEMPRLTKSDEDDVKMFLDHVEEGFKKKVVDSGHDQDTYLARVEEEVQLIVDKNFCGYFNIVADYTKAAKTGTYGEWIGIGKQPPMLVGPSRGSAGGSLVAYLMDITEIDPIKYNLLFGRFLSPARKGYPDIDLDFPQSKRPQMKEYLSAKYGGDHVCAIGTRSKSKPRGILADLCRAMGISYDDSRKMAAIISEVEDIDTTNVEVSWDEVLLDKGGDLEPWVRKYPGLFEKMGEMVGIIRQASTHAAGILVLPKHQPLLGNLPTRVRAGQVSTQFDMYEVEELGAVKFDILGIRHLDTLEVARELVYQRHGVWLDYYKFGDKEFQDPEIWGLIDDGDTDGLFQLEAHQMTSVGKQFRPRHERDVADLISVNRPGVIRADLLSPYLKRRHGLQETTYDHPLMEQIVGKTHGIIVYQEQVLLTVMQLAGFTVDEAEQVRKILGKMLYSEMKKLEGDFIEGCWGNKEFMEGVPRGNSPQDWLDNGEKIAHKIWISIQESGIYVFNEAHAIGYATITSWETWLKKKYHLEDLASLMRTDPPKVNRYIREARQHGVPILPPDVNQSDFYFTLVGNDVRYGLESIKGVGSSAVNDILKQRPFGAFEEFLEKCSSTGGGKKQVVIALIKIGAFDTFGEKRGDLLQRYYNHRIVSALSVTKLKKIDDDGGLTKYLAGFWESYYDPTQQEAGWTDEYPTWDFDDEKVVYEIEKELVGNFISIDPMLKYANAIKNVCISSPDEIEAATVGDLIVIGGQLMGIKLHKTVRGRNPGQEMAFLTVKWNDEEFSVTCFPESWQAYKQFLQQGAPVAIQAIRLEEGCHLSTMERLDYII